MHRRAFIEGSAALGLTLTLAARPRVARAQDLLQGMLRDALDLGRQLRAGAITPTDWQDAIGPALRACPLETLRDGLRIADLRRRVGAPARGAGIVRLQILDELHPDEGAAMRAFFFGADRGDPPHVHFNMVTAHLVLEGRFRVRHYDRLREERSAFLLRPTRERFLEPGDVTSISDVRENGHWHHAVSAGVLVDIEQGRLDPSLPIRRRQLLDLRPDPRADGSILAPFLARSEALRVYG